MKSLHHPERLDVRALARAGEALSGQTPVSQRERLHSEQADSFAGGPSPVDPLVVWSAQGEWRERLGGSPQCWLHVKARLDLPLVCQRCLGPVVQALEVDRSFRFVVDEATAEREDEASEEDVLVLSPAFDLLSLIDDELLMALPLVPRHEPDCPQPVRLTSQDASFDEASAQGRPNPFAALAQLRRNQGGGKP